MTAQTYSDLTPFLRMTWLWPVLSLVLLAGIVMGSRTPLDPVASDRETTVFGSIATLLGAALFASGVVLASPALVEMRIGRGERARSAIRNMFEPHPIMTSADPYGRFVTGPSESASGAVAFYLDYYGLRRSAAAIALGAGDPGWAGLQSFLAAERLPALRIRLDPAHLPNAATLVRFKSGEYGVLTSGLGSVSVFSPAHGGAQNMTPGDVPGVLEAEGLVPKDEPE